MKLELILPAWLESTLVKALHTAHPYEEVAYEVISVENRYPLIGTGLLGELENEMEAADFLQHLALVFEAKVIRHTRPPKRNIKTIALCGGAGSFLVSKALSAGVDAFVSADFKYHEFFDADGRLMICDIGHYESEQYTIDLIKAKIEQKFPNFAVLKTGVNTNPVSYSCQ
jgi:putative NIF3 family GTP cyclohydrolase 1 type 2